MAFQICGLEFLIELRVVIVSSWIIFQGLTEKLNLLL